MYNQNGPYNNFSNGYNNQNNFNQPMYTPPIQPQRNAGGGAFGIIMAIILLVVCIVALLHFSGVVDVVSFANEKIFHKADNNVIDNKNEKDIENTNKKELSKLCKLVDTEGNYKYEEYMQYINEKAAELTEEPTEAEAFEIMSGKSYCSNNGCIVMEKDGTVNFYNCTNNEFLRMSYADFQEYLNQRIAISISLRTSCANLDSNGNYELKDSNGGTEVTCKNFVCSLMYDKVEHTLDCRSDIE